MYFVFSPQGGRIRNHKEKLKDYKIYIPNTGIKIWIPIEHLNKKGLDILLKSYNPDKFKDCYFKIMKKYENDTISIEDAVAILKDEYVKFKYIFELLRQ